MKAFTFLLLLLFVVSINAQNQEKDIIQNTIASFFKDFETKDTSVIKKYFKEGVVLQTIGRGKNGKTRFKTDDFKDFLISLTKIPDSIQFQEKILSYHIQVDDNMANAWTPYEFYVNEKLSHCGVNNFQFLKEEGEWRIIYLVDTRRRKGCKKKY